MGFCRDKVKPAIRRIRKGITRLVIAESMRYIGAITPLVADGKISKDDAGIIAAELVASGHNLSKTSANIAVNLAHEMLTKIGATAEEFLEEEDQAGELEMDEYLA